MTPHQLIDKLNELMREHPEAGHQEIRLYCEAGENELEVTGVRLNVNPVTRIMIAGDIPL